MDRITFKDAGGGLQADSVCDFGCTHCFIYSNDDIANSKHYPCDSSERFICVF